MKKFIIILNILYFLTSCVTTFGQTTVPYNEVINKGIYKSYYSREIQGPSFVIYKLYKGGGNCSRKDDRFKSQQGLPHFNYKKSGYDIGHLANAEDFAYDSYKEKLTFNYINAIPQTPHLNRGTWKHWEDIVRKESQSDSLLIMCGGSEYNNKNIPQHCFKLVYSLTTGKLLNHLFFNNDNVENDTIPMNTSFIKEYDYNKVKNLWKTTTKQ